jgi:TonB family protein
VWGPLRWPRRRTTWWRKSGFSWWRSSPFADPNFLICETCLDTGTRISEVTGLKVKPVDFAGCIRIDQRNWRGDKGGGIGIGTGPGFGSGEGGGIGGGVFRAGGGVSAPTLLSKVEPEYSEEARKAKYQGVVLLYVEVDPSGRAINIRVLHSLGLGLDEKAMEAVRKWRFKPGVRDGRPVTVQAQIEVNFRLL